MRETIEPCCISQVRKGIMSNDENITAVYFDLSDIQNLNESKPRKKKTGQKIEVYYNKNLRNGEVRNVKRNSFISHSFCPFCGKKY